MDADDVGAVPRALPARWTQMNAGYGLFVVISNLPPLTYGGWEVADREKPIVEGFMLMRYRAEHNRISNQSMLRRATC